MNADDLRTLDDKGLLLRQQDLVGELTSLKFQQATGQLENTAGLKAIRRELARVKTIVRARELDKNLSKGGLAESVGKLSADESMFAAFRKRMGNNVENG